MVTFKNLSKNQLEALEAMAYFNCEGFSCEECPLFTEEQRCGSLVAIDIIEAYEKESEL